MNTNKVLKVLTSLSLGTLVMGMMVGCGPEIAAKESEQKYIVVGTNAEFEPFEYREGTEIVGLDIDISKAVAENLGKELKIEDMEFETLTAQVSAGNIDFVAAGLTIDETKSKQVDFSEPYFTTKQVIIVREDSVDVATAEDLKGKTVGVQLGTTGHQSVSADEEINCIPFNKGALAVMDLANGKIDAVVIDEEPAKRMVAAQSGLKIVEAPFVEEEYAIAVQKGNEALLKTINETLSELKQSGKYDELYTKYFYEEK